MSAHLISNSSNGTLNIHVLWTLAILSHQKGRRPALLLVLQKQCLRQATLCKYPIEGPRAGELCKGERETEWGEDVAQKGVQWKLSLTPPLGSPGEKGATDLPNLEPWGWGVVF